MGGGNSVIKTLVWCLVLQVITITGNSDGAGDVSFTISIKNEMNGLKTPAVVYQCWSSDTDFGWHRSLPRSAFSWDFKVPPYGTGVVIHRCHFRSSEGTADIEIKTLSMTSTLCGGHLCKYAVRPDGIFFIGYETYHPDNIFWRFFELLRPVEKLIEPWKPWSPHQLAALRRNHSRSDRNKGSK